MNRILEMLSGGNFVSGEAISRELGISRAAVWKKVVALREQGWQIESGGKRGYRLTAGDSLDPALWVGSLTTTRLGRGENRYEKEVSSTNTVIKEMALAGAPDGSVCIAESQSAGKGRLGRLWSAPEGKGLWVSLLLRPTMPPHLAPLITLCTAMAMAQAVRETAGIDARIKWPNDLVCQGRKICGILLELSADPDRIEYVVVGTGLNMYEGAYPPELAGRAAAVEELADRMPLRRELLVRYLAAMESLLYRLKRDGFEGIAADYAAQSCTLGSMVHVSGAVTLTGTAEAIDETGALLVRTEDGELHRVLSGDVSVRGVMGYV
ncbi:MAG: biotin--[acetyl-CoA-carboxylase] ligase [Christensenellaceae bacterium]|nr:biotin--[acetyl-CoA-carboxylase] ligase [Christensenellaceae bacterium]